MNTPALFHPARLVAFCGALGFAFASPAAAQTTVTTVPVGVMTYSFSANSTASVGIPLLRPAIFSGVVTSASTGSIAFTSPGLNLATLISAGSSYYLEVTGHSDGVTKAYVGDRLEINEATTITSASGVAAIDTLSNINTTSGTLDFLIGYNVTIRPHWTLAALFGTGAGATGLNSSTTFSSSDQVLAWNGGGWSTYWFRQNSAGSIKEWRNTATGTVNQDGAVIPPGVGIYVKKLGNALTANVMGEVRTNRFIRNLDSSTQLIALGYPVDSSPVQLGLTTTSGFTAATTFTVADQILAWSGTGFSTYWLRRNTAGDVVQWRNTATSTIDHSGTAFIAANKAFFIKPVGTPDDIVVGVPFNL
jgi:hypothetical protein